MANQPKNAEKVSVNQNYWTGGMAVSRKLGIPNAYYYSQNLDNRTDPAQLSVLPASRQLVDNLDDLVLAIDQDLNGVRWAVGSAGNIYRIDTSNVISRAAQLTENGSAGLLYNQITDQLYIPGQTAVSMYGQVTSTDSEPSFRSNQFAQSASVAPGCTYIRDPVSLEFDVGGGERNNLAGGAFLNGITEQEMTDGTVQTATATTYAVPEILSENATELCPFAPDIEPFYSIWVYIAAPGGGDWTLTLHDSLNNELAAVTVLNSGLTADAYNEFVFSGQIRAQVSVAQVNSGNYHWHVTSTEADGTAGAVTQNDLSTGDFVLFAYRLVQTNNGWHPTALFTQGTASTGAYLCIGNGNYLSTYDLSNDINPTNTEWVRHQLFFKSGYEVCGITTTTQYLVVATERRSSDSSRNAQDGCLYFWDGTTNNYTFNVDIPMGSPYGIYSFNNIVYFQCAGSLFAWSGGQTVLKVRKLAYQNTDYLGAVDNTIVNPNMCTSRYNLLMMGYPSSTTNPNINYGVWSWGTVELTFPNSYCLSYTLSPGILNDTGGNNLKIGCVQNFVDSMYTSWQYTDSSDVIRYGMDIVDNFSEPAPTYAWESLIWDGGIRFKVKQGLRYKISHLPLPTGTTITPKYSLDRGEWIVTDPTTGTSYTNTTVGSTNTVIELNNARFHELQWGFTGTCTAATTAPTITGVTVDIGTLPEEIDIRSDG
jgi:hypothetical protein